MGLAFPDSYSPDPDRCASLFNAESTLRSGIVVIGGDRLWLRFAAAAAVFAAFALLLFAAL